MAWDEDGGLVRHLVQEGVFPSYSESRNPSQSKVYKRICTHLGLQCNSLARVNIVLDDQLEEHFRARIFEKYGMKKGNIAKAVEEAIQMWIENEKARRYRNVK